MTLDLSRPWYSFPLVVVDFETTGVDPLTCAPVSVAAVRLEDGKEVAHFASLLNEQTWCPPEASAIHGITNDMLVDAPALAEVAHELYAIAADAVPVAYNGRRFDRTILHRYICGSDCPLFDPNMQWIDPLVIIKEIDHYEKGSGRHKLGPTCKRWGLDYYGAEHNALTDVRMTGALLVELVRAGRVKPTTSLARMLERLAVKQAEQDADHAQFRKRIAREKDTQRDFDF